MGCIEVFLLAFVVVGVVCICRSAFRAWKVRQGLM